MSTVVNDVLEKSRQESDPNRGLDATDRITPDEQGLPNFDKDRSRSSTLGDGGVLRNGPAVDMSDPNILAQAVEADKANLPSLDEEVAAQVLQVTNEEDSDNPGHLKNAAYFAQTGGRSGFSYILQTAQGPRPLTFDEGLLITTQISIIEQLRVDIATNPSIAMQIKEITEAHYKQLFETAAAAKQLISAGGLTTSGSVQQDPHELIASQKRQIAELEAKLKERSEKGEDLGEAKKSGFNFNQPTD